MLVNVFSWFGINVIIVNTASSSKPIKYAIIKLSVRLARVLNARKGLVFLPKFKSLLLILSFLTNFLESNVKIKFTTAFTVTVDITIQKTD